MSQKCCQRVYTKSEKIGVSATKEGKSQEISAIGCEMIFLRKGQITVGGEVVSTIHPPVLIGLTTRMGNFDPVRSKWKLKDGIARVGVLSGYKLCISSTEIRKLKIWHGSFIRW